MQCYLLLGSSYYATFKIIRFKVNTIWLVWHELLQENYMKESLAVFAFKTTRVSLWATFWGC